MSKKSDWHVPPDWLFQFSLLLMISAMMLVSGGLLPLFEKLRSANVADLFWSGLILGLLGIALLFYARLPLYRQRQFLKIGPKASPSLHWKLYWLAYAVFVIAVFLMGLVWLQIR